MKCRDDGGAMTRRLHRSCACGHRCVRVLHRCAVRVRTCARVTAAMTRGLCAPLVKGKGPRCRVNGVAGWVGWLAGRVGWSVGRLRMRTHRPRWRGNDATTRRGAITHTHTLQSSYPTRRSFVRRRARARTNQREKPVVGARVLFYFSSLPQPDSHRHISFLSDVGGPDCVRTYTHVTFHARRVSSSLLAPSLTNRRSWPTHRLANVAWPTDVYCTRRRIIIYMRYTPRDIFVPGPPPRVLKLRRSSTR